MTGPSSSRHGDLNTIWLYLNDASEPQVYENVKHYFWASSNTVFVICQYTKEDRSEWRYVYWLREQIQWYQRQPQVFRKAST